MNLNLLFADFAKLEARVAAQQPQELAPVADMHRAKAAELFGIPEAEVTVEQRRYAKTVNYAPTYSFHLKDFD